jgi:hypothetical protein
MKYLFSHIILLTCCFGSAQSNMVVNSQNGDLFTIHLDDKIIAAEFDSAFKVYDLSFGSHRLSLTLESGQQVNKTVYLKDDIEHWFELEVDSSDSKISFSNTFPVDQSDTISIGRTLINEPNHQLTLTDQNSGLIVALDTSIIELDSAALDSLSKLDFSVTYTGTRGCVKPISDFNSRLNQLSSEEFNSRRMKKINSSLKGECLSVKQLGSVISLFEFEDHKLEIVGLLKSSVFDLDNLSSLESQFSLSRNIEQFNFIINE